MNGVLINPPFCLRAYKNLLRSRFISDAWEANAKGNFQAILAGRYVTFFYSNSTNPYFMSGWTWVCHGLFAKRKFGRIEDAKGDAFDQLYPNRKGQ